MWPCCTRVVAGAYNRSERQSAETPERRRAGRGQSCTPREAAPRPSAPAVRRARGAGLHALPHPAESPLCVVSRRLSHCRPHPPVSYPTVRTGGPRGRAAAGERTRARHDPAGAGRGPRAPRAARLAPWRSARGRRAPPLAPATPARHGVRAHLFRVSSDKLRVKRARTPYTARYVKGPRRPTLPGGRLLSHAEGTVDFSLLISLHGAG
jgi:hypothetical protein